MYFHNNLKIKILASLVSLSRCNFNALLKFKTSIFFSKCIKTLANIGFKKKLPTPQIMKGIDVHINRPIHKEFIKN